MFTRALTTSAFALLVVACVAKSPSGDAGFVISGFDDPSEGPNALHRADKEFATTFPVGIGSLSRLMASS